MRTVLKSLTAPDRDDDDPLWENIAPLPGTQMQVTMPGRALPQGWCDSLRH
jgi:hypothetical protein